MVCFGHLARAFFWEGKRISPKVQFGFDPAIFGMRVRRVTVVVICLEYQRGITALVLKSDLHEAKEGGLNRSRKMSVTWEDPEIDGKPSFISSFPNRKFSSASICSRNGLILFPQFVLIFLFSPTRVLHYFLYTFFGHFAI